MYIFTPDIAKTFDSVDHPALLAAMEQPVFLLRLSRISETITSEAQID